MNRLREEAAIAALAAQFLTRLPIPDPGYSAARMAATPRWYPGVGLGLGVVLGAALWLGLAVFPPVVAVLLVTGLGVFMTGAFHEDGFADLCDGLGGGWTRDRALEIMRDSRVGAYGAIGIGLVMAVKVASLAALAGHSAALGVVALIAGQGASRLGPVAIMAWLPYAREEGKAAPVARAPGAAGLMLATGLALLSLLPLAVTAPGAALLAVPGCALGAGLIGNAMRRRLQGYTGDGLGAAQQLGEVGLYLGALAAL